MATSNQGRGRPSLYTPDLASEICRRLADGETLRAICRDEAMPDERTVRTWAVGNASFSPQYAKAREIGYWGMADELLEIADDGQNDTYKDEHGVYKIDQEAIARSRLRVDTRKWLLSKALPKVYGDKLTAEVTGKDGGPIEELITNLPELGRHVAFLLARGLHAQEEEERR
jgi:hypothetical protein